jgi:hypothetical protein
LQGQSPAVFNFQNATDATKVAELPSASNAAPASMQKRYYIDPSTQLFDAGGLKSAYFQLDGIKDFYTQQYDGASSLWEQTRALLFSDRAVGIECYNLAKSVLRGKSADDRIDYASKIVNTLGDSLYNDLKFCITYLGMTYSDWQLWEAYFMQRQELMQQIKSLPGLSNRLSAFIMAVDIKYTLCNQYHPDVHCLKPIKIEDNANK